MLFESQGALGVDSLKRYALAVGLDMAVFDDCLDSGKTAPEVDADVAAGYQAASDAGLTQFGTPAFFINGKAVIGAYPYDEASPGYKPGMLTFKRAIDEALAQAPAVGAVSSPSSSSGAVPRRGGA